MGFPLKKAAFVPFKESLLLSAYEPTKEAIYSLREYVTTATKNGFRPPAAHMTEIANMLKFYEDARAVKQRKTEERNRAKQQAKATFQPLPPTQRIPRIPRMDVDDSGSRSEIGTVPAGLRFKKTPVQPILDSGANVTILSKDKDVIIIDDPIDAAPNKKAKAESRCVRPPSSPLTPRICSLVPGAQKKAARRAEKEKEKEKAEVAPLEPAAEITPPSEPSRKRRRVGKSINTDIEADVPVHATPDFLRKREKEITKDLVAAAYRMQYFYNLRNFFVERLADTRKQREGANLDRFLQDGDV
ncbi:hypothetical protein C8R46DRAFT_1034523 [Mycena filopes]|nr:hypothetical protein C8R46DRAFT_1034523 [Mycena filopes]